MKKEITLEVLAQMVAQGFNETATKAEAVTKKELHKALGEVEERILQKIDHLAQIHEVKSLDRRVTNLENVLGSMQKNVIKTI